MLPAADAAADGRTTLAAILPLLLLLAASAVAPAADGEPDSHRYWPESERAAQRAVEAELLAAVSAERLAATHEALTREPHPAGTPADRRMIDHLAGLHRELGMTVEVQPLSLYLAFPGSAELAIVGAPADPDPLGGAFGEPSTHLPLVLPLAERPLAADPFSRHPELGIGYNAYSASGEVTAGVVYAHHGRREDFERLAELGVEVEGRIVLARYGGNFRGYKAKFAEEAGAAGLVIFTDPADAGYARGPVWPEGGWANGSYIQRGSILTLPYPGDPLTPFAAASAEAERLDPDDVALPTIPVQPIGWEAAWEIVRRMRGGPVPDDWQGGLPATYRLEGGPELELRLEVRQERRLAETANVVATLPGREHPEELVIVGCHFDAWTFGAVDPHAGTMLVIEAARVFAAAAERGWRPRRSLVFAHWGAEEHGILGSVEWVEAHRDELVEGAVAYVNLDSAATGPRFGSSASPPLKALIAEAARAVEHPAPEHDTVHDQWVAGFASVPSFGNLGGGSDHVGFYCHLGVPSCGLGAGGADGVSYHSAYDDLAWYRRVVGEGYEPARMVTRVVVALAARLAEAPLVPLDPVRWGTDFPEHLEALAERAGELGVPFDATELAAAAGEYAALAGESWSATLERLADGELTGADLTRANRTLRHLSRLWLADEGLPERPWYRNLYAATDPDSGYAAWMLPALTWAVERRRVDEMPRQAETYLAAFERLSEAVGELGRRTAPTPGGR